MLVVYDDLHEASRARAGQVEPLLVRPSPTASKRRRGQPRKDRRELIGKLGVIVEDVQPTSGGKDDTSAVRVDRLPHATIMPAVVRTDNALLETRPLQAGTRAGRRVRASEVARAVGAGSLRSAPRELLRARPLQRRSGSRIARITSPRSYASAAPTGDGHGSCRGSIAPASPGGERGYPDNGAPTVVLPSEGIRGGGLAARYPLFGEVTSTRAQRKPTPVGVCLTLAWRLTRRRCQTPLCPPRHRAVYQELWADAPS